MSSTTFTFPSPRQRVTPAKRKRQTRSLVIGLAILGLVYGALILAVLKGPDYLYGVNETSSSDSENEGGFGGGLRRTLLAFTPGGKGKAKKAKKAAKKAKKDGDDAIPTIPLDGHTTHVKVEQKVASNKPHTKVEIHVSGVRDSDVEAVITGLPHGTSERQNVSSLTPVKAIVGKDGKKHLVGVMKFSICCNVPENVLDKSKDDLRHAIYNLGRTSEVYRQVAAGTKRQMACNNLELEKQVVNHIPAGTTEFKVDILNIDITHPDLNLVKAFENGLWIEFHREIESRIKEIILHHYKYVGSANDAAGAGAGDGEDGGNAAAQPKVKHVSVSWVSQGAYPLDESSASKEAHDKLLSFVLDHEKALKHRIKSLVAERSEDTNQVNQLDEELNSLNQFVHMPDTLYPLALGFTSNVREVMADTILGQQMLKERRIENEKHLIDLKKKRAQLEKVAKEMDDDVETSKKSRDDAIQKLRLAQLHLAEAQQQMMELKEAVIIDSQRLGRYVTLIKTYTHMLATKAKEQRKYNVTKYQQIIDSLRGVPANMVFKAKPRVLRGQLMMTRHSMRCQDTNAVTSCNHVYTCKANKWANINDLTEYGMHFTTDIQILNAETKGLKVYALMTKLVCPPSVDLIDKNSSYLFAQVPCIHATNGDCMYSQDVYEGRLAANIPNTFCIYFKCTEELKQKALTANYHLNARLFAVKLPPGHGSENKTDTTESSPSIMFSSILASVTAIIFTGIALIMSIYFIATF